MISVTLVMFSIHSGVMCIPAGMICIPMGMLIISLGMISIPLGTICIPVGIISISVGLENPHLMLIMDPACLVCLLRRWNSFWLKFRTLLINYNESWKIKVEFKFSLFMLHKSAVISLKISLLRWDTRILIFVT